MNNTSKYMKAFIAEAQEGLLEMNRALLELEKAPSIPAKKELLDELFRHAHTMKGGAASMGYVEISTMAHEMESLMDKLRSKKIKPEPPVVDILFETLDLLEMLVESVTKQKKSEIAITPLINKLKAISANGSESEPEMVEEEEAKAELAKEVLEEKHYNIHVRIKLRDDCVFKSVRAFMALKNLGKIGEIAGTDPEVRDLEDEKFDQSFSVFLTTKENEEKIRKTVESVSEVERVKVLAASRQLLRDSALSKAQTVRVDIERLDKLMDLVGELVIDKTRLIRISLVHEIPELTETTGHLERLIADIQYEVMQARLVPVDMIFNRFPRMVRDLARTKKKKINLIIKGTEIEVDRSILDRLSDPLIHMLRNAVDHGIESASERKKAGKAETGSIILTADRQKEHVVIEVSDDGRGIDPDRVLDATLNKGMVVSEAELSDMEKLMLIFTPGLSTCKKATDLSGRGVGMDVVKTTIESLGGTVTINSNKGTGTKFTLKLPLTTAIARGLLVKVQGETFVVPLAGVQEIVGVKTRDVETIKGQEVISIRGEVLPLVSLDRVLEFDFCKEKKAEFFALMVETGNKRAALAVDSLLGQQEIVVKPLEGYLKGVRGYAGNTILGDGKAAFILDVPSLV